MKKAFHLFRLPWHDRLNVLHGACVQLKTRLYYSHVFGRVGHHCRIYKPLLLSNPRFVFIGNNTLIRAGARIETIILHKADPPTLKIGSNVNIEQNAHLICGKGIIIEDNVSIAPNCAILDTKHPFRDITDQTKLGDRIEPGSRPIIIGANTLIGFGSIILPNVRIGKNCIIGANSTVRHDVPDYCVAAGNPASIVLRYDFEHGAWVSMPSLNSTPYTPA
jgi:acetyltransferase-like isoleucine patch superfamily enzyme